MKNALRKGVFVLSIDTELAWGSVHGGKLHDREQLFRRTRACISNLIKLLVKHQIHATWAVVGHLFLQQCNPVDGIKHPDIIRPNYQWFPHDWFSPDPCSTIQQAPLWYGRDIIEQIQNCPITQEIGCHSFSHIRIGETGCSRECFASELEACRREATSFGLKLQSFVFPRNSIAHLEVLSRAGYICYRGVTPSWYENLPWFFPRIGRQLTYLLPISPPVVLPQKVAGIWNLPASFFYPVRKRVEKAKQGLRQASKKQRIFHLWFHPFNLASDPHGLLADLDTIFSEVCRYRDQGLLQNLTMKDLALSLDEEHQIKD